MSIYQTFALFLDSLLFYVFYRGIVVRRHGASLSGVLEMLLIEHMCTAEIDVYV